MPAKLNIIGRKFTRALALEEASPCFRRNGKPRRQSRCLCDCGTVFVARNEDLLSGNTRSCGCLHSETTTLRSTKHGHAKRGALTRTYAAWREMLTRVNNPGRERFADYGGRGITVCARWETFENFIADMGECPSGLEIDRWPNNDGNYEPGNCRWATRTQQARNKRNNRVFTVNGITACLAELCERHHLRYGLVVRRLAIGWPIERALSEPLHVRA